MLVFGGEGRVTEAACDSARQAFFSGLDETFV